MTTRLTDAELAEIEKRWRGPTTELFRETREDIITLLDELRRLQAIEAAARKMLTAYTNSQPYSGCKKLTRDALRATLDGGRG